MFTSFLFIGVYFLCIFSIGFSSRKVRSSFKEYILANRSVHEIIIGISHISSEISIGTFTVVASMIYTIGLSRLWVDLGFFAFNILSWQLIAKRLRVQSEANGDALTIPQYLTNEFNSKTVGILASAIITFFTTTYIGANMLGLNKLLSKLTGLDPLIVSIPVLFMTLMYTMGGFRSTSHVNVIQGMIMVLAACILPFSLFTKFGMEPLTTFFERSVQDNVASFSIPQALLYFSFASAMFGTPHTITKFLAINSPKKLNTARNTSVILNVVIYIGIAISAVYGIKILPSVKDPEMLLFYLGQTFSNPFSNSMMVLAMVAAVMSTMDAQLMLSSSCVVNDIYRHFARRKDDTHLIFVTKFVTTLVGITALLLSLTFNQSVGKLAIFSLTGLGASVGPVILFTLYAQIKNKIPALLGLTSGATATILLTIFNTSDIHYAMLPSLCVAVAVMAISSYITTRFKRTVKIHSSYL